MKSTLHSIVLLLVAATILCASDDVQLTAHCYSLPRSESLGFILAKNPFGEAGFCMGEFDSMVSSGKASKLLSISVTVPIGQRQIGKKEQSTIDAEITSPPDRSVYDITCQISVKEATLKGSCFTPLNRPVFLGATSLGKDSDSVAFVFLMPHTKAE
jgi:hypothetical protein